MKTIKPICRGQLSFIHPLVTTTAFFFLTILFTTNIMAQEKSQMVRLAKIKVDALQLEKYNAALKEQMTTAIRVEAGVLTYYAVADKKDPTSITILEIYADTAAYNSHITTPHFLKYKATVKNMVTSLELVDVTLIASAKKEGMESSTQ
ncbi:putative quinol monooxygenase [Chitinophagaceae bacterium 26-R-25]|nr:putative quinol monooxygenase [Chitinophagaceae bacterium 26-R-25]